MSECAHCEAQVPEGSRFCLECGRPLTAASSGGGLRGLAGRIRAPSGRTVAAVALAAGGFGLVAGGLWEWGVAALLVTAVLVLLPVGIDRRRMKRVQDRAGAIRESLAVRGRGQVEVFRARRELAELEAERGRLYGDLGRAVYEEDEAGTKAARTALGAVVERVDAKEAEIETLIRETEERVRRVQGPVQPTEVLQDEAPPEPPRVPEPWPPPDEGDIPEPPQPDPGGPTPGPEEPAPPVQPPAPGASRRN